MKNFPTILLTFTIFPIFLGLVIGYFEKDYFTPSVEMPIMSVAIVDEDNSSQSKYLVDFLNSEEIKEIIEIDEEDAKYTIIIPKGYGNSLLDYRENNIEIHVEKEGSIRRAEILGDIIDRYNEEISKALYIEDKIDNMDIPQEEIESIGEKILIASNTQLADNKLINTKKSLTSYEHMSITFLSYMFFLAIMSLIGSEDMEKTDGTYNRIMSTPITKVQYFNCNQVSFYFMALLMNALYIFAYRIFGLSFQGSLAILILIILTQSFLVTALSGFIVVFLEKKWAKLIVYILMMMQLILGVTYTSIESMNFEFLKILSQKYAPDILIRSTFRNYLIYNDLNSIKSNLILILGISIGLYILSIAKLKWGENHENAKA